MVEACQPSTKLPIVQPNFWGEEALRVFFFFALAAGHCQIYHELQDYLLSGRPLTFLSQWILLGRRTEHHWFLLTLKFTPGLKALHLFSQQQ